MGVWALFVRVRSCVNGCSNVGTGAGAYVAAREQPVS